MSGYWDDIESYEKRKHERDMEYVNAKHDHKMAELEKEVELYKLKEKKKDE